MLGFPTFGNGWTKWTKLIYDQCIRWILFKKEGNGTSQRKVNFSLGGRTSLWLCQISVQKVLWCAPVVHSRDQQDAVKETTHRIVIILRNLSSINASFKHQWARTRRTAQLLLSLLSSVVVCVFYPQPVFTVFILTVLKAHIAYSKAAKIGLFIIIMHKEWVLNLDKQPHTIITLRPSYAFLYIL